MSPDVSFSDLCYALVKKDFTQVKAAASFKISKRTLIRRLSKENTTWTQLKNDVYNATQSHQNNKSSRPAGKGRPVIVDQGGLISPPSKGLGALPPSLQFLVDIGPKLINIPSFLAPLVIAELKNIQHQTAKKRIIVRPSVYHPKQHELIDAVKDPKIKLICCYGAQRSGKSTGVMQGLHEYSIEQERPLHYLLLAGKAGKNSRDGGAKGILSDLMRDEFLEENNKKLLDLGSKTSDCVRWNGGQELVATDLTVASIKGGDKDVVWIDEMDVAIKLGKDKREAVIAAVHTMLAVEHFKLILTSNLDKGLYVVLLDRIRELGYSKDEVKVIHIIKSDCPHLMKKSLGINYDIARVFDETLADKGYAKMRLDGVMSYEGDIFDNQSIKDAFDIYDTLLATEFDNPDEFWKETDYNVLAIDPSGQGHPFGWFAGAVHKSFFIEIDSGEMQMGLDEFGQKMTPNSINVKIYYYIKKYNIKYVVIESNTGGPTIYVYVRQKGFRRIEYQNFGRDGAYNARSNYLQVCRACLDNRAVALKNRELHPQLTIYDPDARQKDDKKVSTKGDIADGFIHFIWKAAGGLEYIKKNTPKQQTIVKIL